MNLDLVPRACPLCGGEDYRVFAEANIDQDKLTASAFSSRKLPEYMHARMTECRECGMLYANPGPRQEMLAGAYKDASFDSQAESALAAQTYRTALQNHLGTLPARHGALDIGAGDGAFLEQLLAMGFDDVVGVEPSEAPIQAAKPATRPRLRHDIFIAEQFPPESFDLITCFQVLEHLWDPLKIARDALVLLKPGGLFFIVVHNRRAMSARILGTKSPIFDIEHLQLFDKRTGTTLLRSAGFRVITVGSLKNRYPLEYWIKLFPFPDLAKEAIRRIAKSTGIGATLISLPAGNLALIGQKPGTAA